MLHVKRWTHHVFHLKMSNLCRQTDVSEKKTQVCAELWFLGRFCGLHKMTAENVTLTHQAFNKSVATIETLEIQSAFNWVWKNPKIKCWRLWPVWVLSDLTKAQAGRAAKQANFKSFYRLGVSVRVLFHSTSQNVSYRVRLNTLRKR